MPVGWLPGGGGRGDRGGGAGAESAAAAAAAASRMPPAPEDPELDQFMVCSIMKELKLVTVVYMITSTRHDMMHCVI